MNQLLQQLVGLSSTDGKFQLGKRPEVESGGQVREVAQAEGVASGYDNMSCIVVLRKHHD